MVIKLCPNYQIKLNMLSLSVMLYDLIIHLLLNNYSEMHNSTSKM